MKSKKTKVATKKVTSGAAAPAPQGSEGAYTEYLAAASALPASAVVPFRGDANVIYTNVQTGVASVMAQKAALLKQLPNEDLSAFTNLPNVALGLIFAAMQARPGSKRDPAKEANVAEMWALRKVLLTSATALAQAGVLDPAAVAKVQTGRGPLDAARDLIDLGSLFRVNAAKVAGKSPVTSAQIARAAVLGTTLQGQLTPSGAPAKPNATATGASATRDRFFALVMQGHDRLWRVGALLFGEAGVATRVPALLSHRGRRTVATQAAKAARAATKATAKATKAATRATSVKTKVKKKP